MKNTWNWRGIAAVLLCVVFGGAVVLASGIDCQATDSGKKKAEQTKAYAVFVEKCTSCHVSVADPEKPGRTRDDWHLVVKVMHGYGIDLTDEESEMIIELLYDLRKGMEREAG